MVVFTADRGKPLKLITPFSRLQRRYTFGYRPSALPSQMLVAPAPVQLLSSTDRTLAPAKPTPPFKLIHVLAEPGENRLFCNSIQENSETLMR